jgi:hypothetical protein
MRKPSVIFILVLSVVGPAACSTERVTLVQPRTGATIECTGSGWGIMAPAAPNIVDECARKFERDGYVPVERLTPGERADLERREATPSTERRPGAY